MSKLYNQYVKLKSETKDKIYLFKSGIFYICLDDDAQKLSEIFSFKVTHLNESVVKCGFPVKRLGYYLKLLEQMNIDFEIIDNEIIIDNYEDYLDNCIVKNTISQISNLKMEEISYKQAFEILLEIQENLKKLETGYNNGK